MLSDSLGAFSDTVGINHYLDIVVRRDFEFVIHIISNYNTVTIVCIPVN